MDQHLYPSGKFARKALVSSKYNGFISAFTRGDADISACLNKWWDNHEALPQEQKPMPLPITAEEQKFINKALATHGK